MSLTATALKRPIAVAMMFLGLVLLGFLSWQRLPLELLPSINFPQLTIVTNCENMGPLEIEALITKKVEAALGTMGRIRRLRSYSREGVSLVYLDFAWGTNMNYASLDIREKLDQVQDLLPREAKTPMIVRFNPESLPVVTLALQVGQAGAGEPPGELAEKIRRDLERVAGVASVRLSGAPQREIRVEVHQGRLLAHNIAISALLDGLKTANINFPGGKLTHRQQEYRLRTVGEFKDPGDINQVGLLSNDGKRPVFIRDVAEVRDTFQEEPAVARLNGQPSLLLAVHKMSDANTVAVVNGVKERAVQVQEAHRGRLQLVTVQDQGRYIQQAIGQLQEAVVLGGILAFLVLLGFLGDWRSAGTVVTAIPISILATFALMYLAGISLNIMSLGGLALAVGMLVDNGVVVLENIRRHQESSFQARETAIVTGADEVKLAITSSTLAHIIVFLPVIFVAGLAGQIMSHLALTISFALLVSLAVSLFFNPMLISLERPDQGSPARLSAGINARALRMKQRLEAFYFQVLEKTLYRPGRVFLATGLILAMGTMLFFTLDREFLPPLDQREFFLRVHAPPNSSYDSTVQQLKALESLILARPGVETVITQLGYNRAEEYDKVLLEREFRVGQIAVTLQPQRKFPQSAADFIQELRPALVAFDDTKIDIILPQAMGQWWSQKAELPELVAVEGPDIAILEELAGQIKDNLSGIKGLHDLEVDLKRYGEETRVVLDRERTAAFGLTIKEVGENLKIAIQGEVATQYRKPERDVDIRVKMIPADYKTKTDLSALFIHSRDLQTNIPLQAVAHLETGPGLREIYRSDQVRTVPIRGNAVDRRLSAAQADIQRQLAALPLPQEYRLVYGGDLRQVGESFQSLMYALALSIVLVYLLLAGQFESLFHPLIILAAIPSALIGVVIILALGGASLNLGVYLGAIMLGGIVVNNSILLVDYINTLRRRGHPLEEAVLQGSMTRLRPVLMTTLTTILGLLPMLFLRGEGAELRSPLALTVICGLTISTMLTFILAPLLYYKGEQLLSAWRRR